MDGVLCVAYWTTGMMWKRKVMPTLLRGGLANLLTKHVLRHHRHLLFRKKCVVLFFPAVIMLRMSSLLYNKLVEQIINHLLSYLWFTIRLSMEWKISDFTILIKYANTNKQLAWSWQLRFTSLLVGSFGGICKLLYWRKEGKMRWMRIVH